MRDNRDILEKLRATVADMEYMEVPGEWLVPVEEAKAEITRLRAENERLRAALRDMLRLVEDDEDDPAPYLIDVVCDRARAALAAQPAPGKEGA